MQAHFAAKNLPNLVDETYLRRPVSYQIPSTFHESNCLLINNEKMIFVKIDVKDGSEALLDSPKKNEGESSSQSMNPLFQYCSSGTEAVSRRIRFNGEEEDKHENALKTRLITTNSEQNLTKTHSSSVISNILRRIEKELKNFPQNIHDDEEEDLLNFKNYQLRGGGVDTHTSDTCYPEIFSKLSKYSEKILHDSENKKELSLYIEARARAKRDSNETSELSFEIRKKFLNVEEDGSLSSPKVFLITGQVGVGKSFFCKQLQRELMTEWKESQNQKDIANQWFPVYAEFSSLKNSKSEAISEALMRALSLTQEEILTLLQFSEEESEDKVPLPKLLFILDGYDSIDGIHEIISPGNEENYLKNNFCILNQIQEKFWRNAKIIITCREENLQGIERRDLLLGPIVKKTGELVIEPNSFMQSKIEPFTDEQITCYLKKYFISQQVGQFDEHERKESSGVFTSDTMTMSLPSLSWQEVKEFEKMIDDNSLREAARIPTLLKLIVDVLPSIIDNDPDFVNSVNQTQKPAVLTSRYIIECFVNKTIKLISRGIIDTAKDANNKEENNADLKQQQKNLQKEPSAHEFAIKLTQQAQDLALRLHHYSREIKISDHANKFEDNFLSIDSCPLSNCDISLTNFNFQYPFIIEYFVAKRIEEEMFALAVLKKDRNSKAPNDFLFNHRLLTNQTAYSPIVLLLLDLIQEKRLSTEQLLDIICLSSSQNSSVNDMPLGLQESRHLKRLSPFTVAAANSISILNFSGYDFKNHDLSNVCIAGANLSFGNFEGTNFTNATLRGVNFIEAYLDNATLINTNMRSINFGNPTYFKFDTEKIVNIAFSPNEKSVAIDIGNQTIIYEIQYADKKFALKTKSKLLGQIPFRKGSPFSKNGTQILTKVGNCLHIWDVNTGYEIGRLDLPSSYFSSIHFNSEKSELIFFYQREIQKYSIESKKWSNLWRIEGYLQDPRFDITSGLSNNEIIAMGFHDKKKLYLINSLSGKPVLKQRKEVNCCRFSSDEKQVVSSYDIGDIQISDCVRGHYIKSLSLERKYFASFRYYSNCNAEECALTLEGKLILSTKSGRIRVQDAASSVIETDIPSNNLSWSDQLHSFSRSGKYIAVVEDGKAVFKICHLNDRANRTAPFRGSNSKGLSLRSTVINNAINLSKENILLFQKKGDYGIFSEEALKKLFLVPPASAASVFEISGSNSKLNFSADSIIGKDLYWINLRRLDLSTNSICGKVIAENKSWPHLEELILNNTNLEDQTAIMIAKNESWKNLKRLELATNQIKSSGGIAIGKNSFWVKLEVLNLYKNAIKDQGAISIGENNIWKSLRELDLGANAIGNEGASALATNAAWPCLEKLHLHLNKIKDADVMILLCSNATWGNIKVLRLEDNPARLEAKDILHVVDYALPKSLELLSLPRVILNSQLLQCLKRPLPENVIEVTLTDRKYSDEQLAVIGSNRSWTNLKKLNLSRNKLTDVCGRIIGNNTAWCNLEELDLSRNQLEKESGIAIGKNSCWEKLTILNLENNKIGVEGGCLIANNITWKNLQTLNLQSNLIGDKGTIELSYNTVWTNLQDLCLCNNSITFAGAAALSKNATWQKLQRLNLGSNKLSDEGVIELSKNTSWINLQELLLFNNSIRSRGMAGLRNNASWANLLILNLSNNLIDVKGVRELNNNSSWTRLRSLNLASNKLGDEGAAELRKNAIFIHLQVLNLGNNEIENEGASELSKNKSWIELKELNLSNNLIGCKGITDFSKNMSWTNLRLLNLGNNKIDTEGAAGLSNNKSWLNLKTLFLSDNSIGSKGVAELSNNSTWANLQVLNLANNKIGAEGVMALSLNKSWIKLEELILCNNVIGSKGAAELSRKSTWTNLRILNLGNNTIDDTGAKDLSENTTWANLQVLILDCNDIRSEGTAALSKNTTWISLQSLNLHGNHVGTAGIKTLKENIIWKNLIVSV